MDTVRNVRAAISNKLTDIFGGYKSLSDRLDIERSIIDSSVGVGYTYDARNDSVEGMLDGNIEPKNEKMQNAKASCIMYKGEDIKIENLLRILQIDNETCLSTILKLIKPKGILSIVNYSYIIDEFTRLIYYFEPIEEHSLIYDFHKQEQFAASSTHIITKIKFGISSVIILQLSPQNTHSIKEIDKILQYFTSNLDSNLGIDEIIYNEEQFLKNIVTTKIYSNVNDLSRLENICEFYRKIHRIRTDSQYYGPLNFVLSPILDVDLTKHIYIPIKDDYITDIVASILPLAFNINVFGRDLKDFQSSLLKDYLNQQLDHTKQLFKQFEKLYLSQLNKLKDSVIQVRGRQLSQDTLIELLNATEMTLLREKRDDIIKYLNDLKSKNSLIFELQKEKIDYLNISNIDINQDDDQQTLENKLMKDDQNICIFCSNDELRHTNDQQWNEFMEKLIKSRVDEKNLRLVYVDFSYSLFQLGELRILHPKRKKKNKVTGSSKKDSNNKSSEEDLEKKCSNSESTINIVLFGESGVGKSTFINAFANYLLFESIEHARSKEAIVIIPVSFLMTINDQFEERHIQFGPIHSNENHNNLGQSVTQQCKTYEFSIPNGKVLKIIDTPGFGDTRGQDQDEKNLKEIFSYIQNLRHLNALCILLKPNVKELNPSFRSSFREILHFFGNQFYKNIFFCFTNSQSTFFTVGDTGPQLNKFLQTSQQKQISLKKENTFCFDSESFRYLVASQHSIKFDQQFIEQFEQSWLKSVKESYRFIDQICSRELQKNINQTWISIEQIKREINYLIRPILETIRNISRNIILIGNQSFEKFIQLIIIPHPSSNFICYKVDRSIQTFGEFHIMLDHFHKSSDQCDNEHLITNYKLDYQFVEKKIDYSTEDANSYLYGIVKASAHFDYFLNDNDPENKGLPFLFGINRMINEEKLICERKQAHHLNKKLYRRLEKIKDQYYKDLKEINSTNQCSYLERIYSRIEGIKAMPMVYQQINFGQHKENQNEND